MGTFPAKGVGCVLSRGSWVEGDIDSTFRKWEEGQIRAHCVLDHQPQKQAMPGQQPACLSSSAMHQIFSGCLLCARHCSRPWVWEPGSRPLSLRTCRSGGDDRCHSTMVISVLGREGIPRMLARGSRGWGTSQPRGWGTPNAEAWKSHDGSRP